jgi:hypothetical protein
MSYKDIKFDDPSGSISQEDLDIAIEELRKINNEYKE